MRCPDCSKFVGLETAEPQELTIDADGCITASYNVERNCQECGTTLKSAVFELEDWLDADVLKEHTNDEGASGPHELEIRDSSDVEEGGGGRYSKNVFKVLVDYTVTCKCDKEFKHDGQAVSEGVAASSFKECV